jgi:hypothetical protein
MHERARAGRAWGRQRRGRGGEGGRSPQGRCVLLARCANRRRAARHAARAAHLHARVVVGARQLAVLGGEDVIKCRRRADAEHAARVLYRQRARQRLAAAVRGARRRRAAAGLQLRGAERGALARARGAGRPARGGGPAHTPRWRARGPGPRGEPRARGERAHGGARFNWWRARRGGARCVREGAKIWCALGIGGRWWVFGWRGARAWLRCLGRKRGEGRGRRASAARAARPPRAARVRPRRRPRGQQGPRPPLGRPVLADTHAVFQPPSAVPGLLFPSTCYLAPPPPPTPTPPPPATPDCSAPYPDAPPPLAGGGRREPGGSKKVIRMPLGGLLAGGRSKGRVDSSGGRAPTGRGQRRAGRPRSGPGANTERVGQKLTAGAAGGSIQYRKIGVGGGVGVGWGLRRGAAAARRGAAGPAARAAGSDQRRRPPRGRAGGAPQAAAAAGRPGVYL